MTLDEQQEVDRDLKAKDQVILGLIFSLFSTGRRGEAARALESVRVSSVEDGQMQRVLEIRKRPKW